MVANRGTCVEGRSDGGGWISVY